MNFVSRQVENYILGVHGALAPTTEEWNQLLDLVRATSSIRGSLVYTSGGAPSALQRKQLRDIALVNRSVQTPTALLTDSIIARTAILALNLFLGGSIKAFAPSAIDEALIYMKAPPEVWATLKQALEELKKEVRG